MRIATVRHRGLRRLLRVNDDREIRADLARRVRHVLSVLMAATEISGVGGPPGWRVHQLSGDRAGTWSISVSGNWRITFEIAAGEVRNLDLEDYH